MSKLWIERAGLLRRLQDWPQWYSRCHNDCNKVQNIVLKRVGPFTNGA